MAQWVKGTWSPSLMTLVKSPEFTRGKREQTSLCCPPQLHTHTCDKKITNKDLSGVKGTHIGISSGC